MHGSGPAVRGAFAHSRSPGGAVGKPSKSRALPAKRALLPFQGCCTGWKWIDQSGCADRMRKISFFFDGRPLLVSFAGNARVRPAETVTFRVCRKAQRVVWNGRREYYYWYGAPQRTDAGKPAKFEKRRRLQQKTCKNEIKLLTEKQKNVIKS